MFDIDANVNDIVWCGNSRETILILTDLSSLYKSEDHGFTWKKMNDILQHTGKLELEENENEIGKVSKIELSPVDKNIVVFLGTHGINWVTQDCGRKVKALNHGRKVTEYIFHPTEKHWGIASAFTLCDDFIDEPCRINKEIFLTQDLGENWNTLASYVVQFSWGIHDQSHIDAGIPKERILLAYEPRGKGHQKSIGWNYKVDFIFSDDFFKTKKIGIHKGNKFLLTKSYLFIAQVMDQEDQEVQLLVANPKDKVYDFKAIDLSQTRFREHSYTFLDTTENSVFIHVNHFGEKSQTGHIYTSDAEGQKFSLSLHHNLREGEGQCDFDKLNGLEGIYMANVVNQDWMKDAQLELQKEEAEQSQMTESTTKDKKKDVAKSTKTKAETMKDYIQSYITFNKGGMWHLIKAPERDFAGKRYDCGENCYLNLHGFSSPNPPFYSVDSAAGIVIANGNVGQFLSNEEDEINTFLSRDGGLTWFEVKKGSHIYEIGDHGSLIVIAEEDRPTNNIYYSWDEGLTWNELKLSQEKITVRNIIIEPTSTTQRFVVYGQTQNKKGVKKGVVIAVDFSSIHEPQCRNPNEPGSTTSDYETWTPNDGRLGHECLLGRKTIYIRRKREAECYNGETFEKKSNVELCDCTEDDYECEVGYLRDAPGEPCTSIEKKKKAKKAEEKKKDEIGGTKKSPAATTPAPTIETEILAAPENCNGFYTISKGYRRIPGDVCVNGVKFDPILIPCPGGGFFSSLGYLFFFILVLVLVGLVIVAFNRDCLDSLKGIINEKLAEHKKNSGKKLPEYYNIDTNEDDNTLFEDDSKHERKQEPMSNIEDSDLLGGNNIN